MALLVLLTGCGGSKAKEPTKGDVIVYVAVPLSGFQANGGQTVLGGVRLAAEEINLRRRLLGYRVVVRPLDDESDSDVAVAQVAQIQDALSKGERVIGVIGHLNSGQTSAAMELYKDLPLIIVTPTASEQGLSQRGYTNFFRVNASDDVQAAVDARFLVEKLGVKRIAVVHNNTDYGKGLAASLVKELEARGGQAVVQIEVEEGQSTYDAEVPQIQGANPEAIFYAGYEIETPFPALCPGAHRRDRPNVGERRRVPFPPNDDSRAARQKGYTEHFRRPAQLRRRTPGGLRRTRWSIYRNPDTYSVNGYVAMQVLLEGVTKANSLESGKIAETCEETASPLCSIV
jgi:branched-chain amino acid transport system substrate-binding protein